VSRVSGAHLRGFAPRPTQIRLQRWRVIGNVWESRGLETKIHSHDVTNHQLGCFTLFLKKTSAIPRFGHSNTNWSPEPTFENPGPSVYAKARYLKYMNVVLLEQNLEL